MHISSANTGAFSRPGLYPPPVSSSRRDDVDVVANAADKQALAATRNARSVQQVVPALAASNSEATRALVLARQGDSSVDLAEHVKPGEVVNDTAARRAVAQYAAVAGTEQRFELSELLVGIDVFV